jgi:hypothetical protein
MHNGVCYSSRNVFNKLPSHIVNYVKIQLPSRTHQQISHKNSPYAINEFISGNYYEADFKFLRNGRS